MPNMEMRIDLVLLQQRGTVQGHSHVGTGIEPGARSLGGNRIPVPWGRNPKLPPKPFPAAPILLPSSPVLLLSSCLPPLHLWYLLLHLWALLSYLPSSIPNP